MLGEDFSEQLKEYNSKIWRYDANLYDENHEIIRVYAMKIRGIEFKILYAMDVCIGNYWHEEGVCVVEVLIVV